MITLLTSNYNGQICEYKVRCFNVFGAVFTLQWHRFPRCAMSVQILHHLFSYVMYFFYPIVLQSTLGLRDIFLMFSMPFDIFKIFPFCLRSSLYYILANISFESVYGTSNTYEINIKHGFTKRSYLWRKPSATVES